MSSINIKLVFGKSLSGQQINTIRKTVKVNTYSVGIPGLMPNQLESKFFANGNFEIGVPSKEVQVLSPIPRLSAQQIKNIQSEFYNNVGSESH